MKNSQTIYIGKILTVCLILIGLVSACKKKEEEPECTNCTQGGGPSAQANLNWKKNGGASTFADDYKFYASSKTLSASYNGTTTTLSVKLTSSAVGTYIFNSTNVNKLTFVENGFMYTATSGSLSISKNENSKISGSFYSYGNSAGVTSLVGDFTEVPIQ